MEKQFAYGKTIEFSKKNPRTVEKTLVLVSFRSRELLRKLEYAKKWAYGKTIRLWKNNSIMEKQFDYGTKFDFEKKNRFGNQISIWKTNFSFGKRISILKNEFQF